MNRMKKFMAMLLAVVLVAQSGFMTYATEDNGSADQIQTIDATEEAEPVEEAGPAVDEVEQSEEAAGEVTEAEQTPSEETVVTGSPIEENDLGATDPSAEEESAVETEPAEGTNVVTDAESKSETTQEPVAEPEETPVQETKPSTETSEKTEAELTEEAVEEPIVAVPESTMTEPSNIDLMSAGAENSANEEVPEYISSKTLSVDASLEAAESGVYTDIQSAINFINEQTDKEDWTIIVESGEYERFVVLSGLNGLTVKTAKDANVTIKTLNGFVPEGVTFGGGTPDTGGVQLWDANNVVLEGLTFKIGDGDDGTHHMRAEVSNHSESTEQADNFTVQNCTFVGNDNMSGQANGNVGISISCFDSFTIEGCTFTNLMEAIRGQSDNADVDTVNILDNDFIDCSFAVHEYAGNADENDQSGTYNFIGNNVIGNSTLYNKAYFEDLYVENEGHESNGYTINIEGNTFENAIVGLVNLEDNAGTSDNVFTDNTINKNTFVVTGSKVSGQIEMHANYTAPENEKGYWQWTGKEDPVGGGNPEDAAEQIQEAIDKANEEGSNILRFGVDDRDNFLLTFTWFKDMIYWVTDETPDPEPTPDPDPTPEVPEWERSKSKEAANLDESYESKVTLSLPSAEEKLVSDVVFVLDKSTSADVEDQAIEMLNDLNTQLKNTGAAVKVGVVIFNKEANNVLELTELTDSTMSGIETAIRTTISSGTNTHAGLLAGIDMLEKDSDVDDSRKYLVFVSDGITYIYNENPTAIGLENGDYTNVFPGPDNWVTKYGNSDAPDDWSAWLGEIEGLIQTDNGKYDDTYREPYPPDGSDSYIHYDDRGNHAMSIDKALYLTYQTYQEAASKYHCYAMGAQSSAAASYPWATSFMEYLAGGEEVSFDTIKNDIYYLLDTGSTVIDEIGSGNDYNFDFVNEAENLVLTVGGTVYTTAVSTGNLGEGETARYTFTSPGVEATNGAEAPYVLHYYADGAAIKGTTYGECFIWDINVPVSNFAPVQLTYSVKLTNPKTAAGTYGQYDADGSEQYAGLYTNNSATLYPVDGNGNEGTPEEFNKPTVSYTVPETPVPEEPTAGTATLNITKKVQANNGDAKKVSTSFYASIFTDDKYQNRYGNVIELKLTDASEVTVTVNVETPADGSSRTYYVMETDKDGNVVSSGKDFGYQIDVKGGQVTVSKTAVTADIVITNQQVKSGSGSHGGSGSSGSGDGSTGSAASTPQQVGSAKTGDTSNLTLYIVLAAVAVAALGACGVIVYKKRKLTK